LRQDEARVELQAHFASQIFANYLENLPTNTSECYATIKPYIDEGYKFIIIGGVAYGGCSQQIASLHPDVYVLQLAGTATKSNLAVAFPRVYQARYITGYMAGKMLQQMDGVTKRAGFVAGLKVAQGETLSFPIQ